MFKQHWEYCKANTKVLAQDFEEMRIIYALIEGCESYLEIGSSEGNSLYIFGHALKPGSRISYIDFAEEWTNPWREPKEKKLIEAGYKLTAIHGNSHHEDIIRQAQKPGTYNCVFIDAGHSYDDALQDARNYGHLATKWLFFHDVQLAPVKAAFLMYLNETKRFGFEVVNSMNYGYGVVKI